LKFSLLIPRISAKSCWVNFMLDPHRRWVKVMLCTNRKHLNTSFYGANIFHLMVFPIAWDIIRSTKNPFHIVYKSLFNEHITFTTLIRNIISQNYTTITTKINLSCVGGGFHFGHFSRSGNRFIILRIDAKNLLLFATVSKQA